MAAQVKPNAYFPREAVRFKERNLLRPETKQALLNVSVLADRRAENSRHHGRCDGLEKESSRAEQSRQTTSDTSAQSEESGKEGADAEEYADEVKGKHEPREVVVSVSSRPARQPLERLDAQSRHTQRMDPNHCWYQSCEEDRMDRQA
jgi:hypothetical protein